MNENTVEEVREFLDRLPQRTPQEAIGMRDEGGLWQGLLVGTAALAVLVLIGTAVPFYLAPATEPGSTAENDVTPAADSVEPEASTAASQPATEASNEPAAVGNSEVADPDRVLDTLGIGEAKEADPEENPRASELENLLDGVN